MLSLDMATLSAGYADGSLTPQAVLDEIYDRIAARGERPVWISLVSKAQALARLQSAPKGKLWGIPFAVKDNIDVAGMPSTAGCPDFAYVPARSATMVERLEAAGAILIGKTNMDQFATGLVGTRTPYGICSSVFSPEHVSGGSSSGSGVAVAAGLVSFALGTDTAGSGRVPAAFNNIVGFKPTKGVLSNAGVLPACRTQDCVSVFAGTVGDALAVVEVAGGFDASDPYSRRSRITSDRLPPGFRFGVPENGLEFFGDTEAEALYASAIARMEELGGKRIAIDFTPFRDAARLLYSGPWVAERLAAIKDFARTKPESMNETVRGIILGGEKLTAVETFEGLYRLAALTRLAEAQWERMDVMLLPTTGTIFRLDEVAADPVGRNTDLGYYTNFVNLMDLSAIAIPAGFRGNGLPFGVTVMGRAFQDGTLAGIADRLHRALPDARIGATGASLPPASRIVSKQEPATIAVAVVGAHLSGQPLHWQLVERRARLLKTTRVAAGYSLYALAGSVPAKPGLVFDGAGAGGIEVEIYEMDPAAFGSFVALIPPPLGIGTITLADGSTVKGFLCESHAIADARNITGTGGWRAWLKGEGS